MYYIYVYIYTHLHIIYIIYILYIIYINIIYLLHSRDYLYKISIKRNVRLMKVIAKLKSDTEQKMKLE